MQQRRKHRLADAGRPRFLSPHSFRVLVVTDLLPQNVPHGFRSSFRDWAADAVGSLTMNGRTHLRSAAALSNQWGPPRTDVGSASGKPNTA